MPRKYQRTSSGWTDERRAKHSAAIRRWAPWTRSTGPRTVAGKAISRCNALTHGATSRPARDFMRHFRLYRDFLRLCWKKRAELAEKTQEKSRNQQNELLNTPKASVGTGWLHHGNFDVKLAYSAIFPPDFPCNRNAMSLKHTTNLAGAVGRCQLLPRQW